MENWLLIVETNCKDKERESDFNDWYDKIHIPDVLIGSPGFRDAIRYVIKNPSKGRGKYLAIYEIETADIKKTMAEHSKNIEDKKADGRWTDLLQIVTRKICRVEAQ
jgi:hypothetical protein